MQIHRRSQLEDVGFAICEMRGCEFYSTPALILFVSSTIDAKRLNLLAKYAFASTLDRKNYFKNDLPRTDKNPLSRILFPTYHSKYTRANVRDVIIRGVQSFLERQHLSQPALNGILSDLQEPLSPIARTAASGREKSKERPVSRERG